MYYKVFLTFNKHTNEIVSFINTKFNINNNLTFEFYNLRQVQELSNELPWLFRF